MKGFPAAERMSAYAHLRTYESDFDKSQSQLRAIASAWSAAVLAAVGLITITIATPFVQPTDGAKILPEGVLNHRVEILFYLREIICAVGTGGIFAFWYVDQCVYQRLLHAVFAYGLALEHKYPDLPQIRSSLLAANLDVTNKLGWFYRSQFWAFVVLSLAFGILVYFSHPTMAQDDWRRFLYIEWTLLVCHMVGAGIGESLSRGWPSLREVTGRLFPDLEASIPDWGQVAAKEKINEWMARIRPND